MELDLTSVTHVAFERVFRADALRLSVSVHAARVLRLGKRVEVQAELAELRDEKLRIGGGDVADGA